LLLGLSTAAFLDVAIEEVFNAAQKNALTALEWSDRHILPGDIETAKRVNMLSMEKSVSPVSYASVFSVSQGAIEEFNRVLQTAQALGTDAVCLSFGFCLPKEDPASGIRALAERIRALADRAAQENVKLCLYYRGEALFDDYVRVLELLDNVGNNNVYLNWQPKLTSSLIFNIYELKMLMPYVHHVYVRYVDAANQSELMMEGKDEWQQYIKVLEQKPERALLFRDCTPETFVQDCALLRDWLAVI